jgi:hypothetical protein
MWTLEDNTNGKNGGYLQICLDGRRVVDAFPYARDADPQWVRAQAQRVVDVMNASEGWRRVSLEDGTVAAQLLLTDEGAILARAVDA